jgi:type I restriction enzyme S subunit
VSCIGWQMGNVIMTNRPSFTNQQINTIVPNESVDPSFLYYSLRPRKSELLSLGAATGVRTPILNKSAFSDLKVTLPPLIVQRRIARTLSAYDELIENSQRRIRILETIARALYREWFVRFRFPGYENHPTTTSQFGEIPDGWDVRCVADVADLVSRGPSLSYVEKGGTPVLNQRCIRNGEIELEAIRFAKPLSEKKAHLHVQLNDTLINSMGVGTLGRVSRNLTIEEPMIVHNCITVVRSAEQGHGAELLFYRLSDCETEFESLGVGSTGQTSLRREAIEGVRFLWPPTELLLQFSQQVQPMWKQIGVLKSRAALLRRTRDLLLPRLLSGRLELEVV